MPNWLTEDGMLRASAFFRRSPSGEQGAAAVLPLAQQMVVSARASGLRPPGCPRRVSPAPPLADGLIMTPVPPPPRPPPRAAGRRCERGARQSSVTAYGR